MASRAFTRSLGHACPNYKYMKLTRSERLLDEFLVDLMSPLGFRRAERLIYLQRLNEATGLLSFSCSVVPKESVRFICFVGLRFQSLQRWLESDSSDPTCPTVVTPTQFLRNDTRYRPWEFCCIEDLEQSRVAIVSDLTTLAIPFLERYFEARRASLGGRVGKPEGLVYTWSRSSRLRLGRPTVDPRRPRRSDKNA